ncbi:MAG: IS200/IS605 family transposon protein TnpB, partial [Halobacteria archaeon]|nr:IS200/IS605 family transposon protein TnpB [Halobacteria archaeon]
MKRTNTFTIQPTGDKKECLLRLLDASASLWNTINYERRRVFFGEGSVWDVDTGEIRGKYKGVLGSATVQQINRKNSSAWRSFFKLNEKWKEGDLENKPYPPGYKGNKDDGRELHTLIRNDCYTVEWGKHSRLEIPIGEQLKEEYDIQGRLRLEIRGNPHWSGEQGRLEIKYDEVDDVFRAFQPVTVDSSRQDQLLTDNEKSVALDIGV